MGKHSNKKENKDEIKENKSNKKKKNENSDKEPEKEIQNEDLTSKKHIGKLLTFVILITLIFISIWQMFECFKWQAIAKQMCKNNNSTVLDITENTIATIGNERIHTNLSSEEIPINLKNAYISIEDERFYKHNGVDLKRTSGAIFSYLIHFGKGTFGGSSISQQLVKNLTGYDDNTINRKINEWIKAIELEACMSKDEILTSYLNIIYVGNNVYGVESGAKYYFNKSTHDLSLAECAFLAGINHSPNYYNPFNEEDKSTDIQIRSKIVLGKMLELKYINIDDYNSAISEVNSGLNFEKGNFSHDNSCIYSYHTDAVISEVISDISRNKNISEEFATNYLFMGGLKIYSTQDSNIQDELEKEYEKKQYQVPSNNIPNTTAQSAMVIMDHNSRFCCWTSSEVLEKKLIIVD